MTTKSTAPALEPQTAKPSVVKTTDKNAKVKKSRGNKKEKPKAPPFDWAKGFETVASQNHSYKSELLTPETVKALKSNMDKVIKTIKSGTEHQKEIATYLFKINGQLNANAVDKYKDKKQIKAQVKSAIKELAERDFNLKASRAFEYIRLVDNGPVFKLDLECGENFRTRSSKFTV